MISVYSVENCPYCNELKETLTKEGIEFIDLDVNFPENYADWKKIEEISKGNDSVPVVKIGKQLLIPNISFKTMDECYDLIKRLLSEL